MSDGGAADAELAAHLATGFAATLRGLGLPVAISSAIDYADALVCLATLERDGCYWAGRAIFVHGPEQVDAYDAAFAAYFAEGGGPAPLRFSQPTPVRTFDPLPADADGPEETGSASEAGMRFSAAERLRHADFAVLTEDELAETHAMLSELEGAPAFRRTRRLGPTPHPQRRPDLRRSVAASVRTDGELVVRHYRERRRRPRPLVILCDVSGSMEPYARAMLRFAHALSVSRPRVEVFAIGTRLTRLTRRLASRDPDLALFGAAEEILDYSGGTRLGDALREFNDRFGIRGTARGATIVVCSDGVDRGAPEIVGEEMARLSRVARRIVWVNPLKSSPGYEPLARGMAAALPYVDEFLPGDSFAALETVARVVAG